MTDQESDSGLVCPTCDGKGYFGERDDEDWCWDCDGPPAESDSGQVYVTDDPVFDVPRPPARRYKLTPAESDSGLCDPRVVARLKSGDWSFGHAGKHHGNGSPDCPRELHHHHDEFCSRPTLQELLAAGIDPNEFRPRGRA